MGFADNTKATHHAVAQQCNVFTWEISVHNDVFGRSMKAQVRATSSNRPIYVIKVTAYAEVLQYIIVLLNSGTQYIRISI